LKTRTILIRTKSNDELDKRVADCEKRGMVFKDRGAYRANDYMVYWARLIHDLGA
jgi:hypothetical protein